MTLIIPYSFVAGTKAQSAQVNENFQAVATEVNSIGSDLADAETNITNLSNNKADINGSTSNRFSVANPVNSYDAVNKQTFTSLCKYILAGLKISRGGDDIITCSAGASYDTTATKILALASQTSKQNTSQVASATYYVYLIGQSTGTGTDLLISTSSTNPPLPTGYDLYVGLGSYTTGSDNKIAAVYGYSYATGSEIVDVASKKVGYPNLAAGVNKTWGTQYTADVDGWVYAMADMRWETTGEANLTVNNVTFRIVAQRSNEGASASVFVPVFAGDTYVAGGTANYASAFIFFPNK